MSSASKQPPLSARATPISAGSALDLESAPWQILHFPIVHDVRGNLSVIESGIHVPFEIKRVYYLYDVPGGTARGGHAHRQLRQAIFAASGSFDVHLHDGQRDQTFSLNRSYVAVFVNRMVWREIDNFSSGAVCMVLASEHYDEADYYRNKDDFLSAVAREKGTR